MSLQKSRSPTPNVGNAGGPVPWRWQGWLGVLIGALLSGCALSTPFPRGAASSGAATDPVVLVLTRVVVNTEQRAEFDRQTNRVIAAMSSHPGLIGFSARRQVFGDTGWTMSIWINDEARTRFVQSEIHQQAIARSLSALVTVELKRLTVARNELPRDWAEAIALLSLPEGRRNYWE